MKLIEHAKRELELAGLFDKGSDYDGLLGPAIMKMVEVFAAEGHSGMSAHLCLTYFDRVARWKSLTSITNDPSEWGDVSGSNPTGPKMWQNIRQSSCFSHDGGKTYYDIDDPKREVKSTPGGPEK